MADMNSVEGISPLEVLNRFKKYTSKSVADTYTITEADKNMSLSTSGTGPLTKVTFPKPSTINWELNDNCLVNVDQYTKVILNGETTDSTFETEFLGDSYADMRVYMGATKSDWYVSFSTRSPELVTSGFPIGAIVYSIRTSDDPPPNCIPLKGQQYNGNSYPKLWRFINDYGLNNGEPGAFIINDVAAKTFTVPNLNNVYILPPQAIDSVRNNSKTDVLGTTLGSVFPSHTHSLSTKVSRSLASHSSAQSFVGKGYNYSNPSFNNSVYSSSAKVGNTSELNSIYYIPYLIYK